MNLTTLLRTFGEKKSLFVLLAISSLLKIFYAVSRNVFPSGPDANGYIPFAQDFATQNFFSSDIAGPPYYPSGYPFILSLIMRFGGDYAIQIIQAVQILTFSVAAYFYFILIKNRFSSSAAWLAFLFLAFNPAWAVVNGEAMYESFFVSFLLFSTSFLSSMVNQKSKSSIKLTIWTGALCGITIVIHPRALLIYGILFLFLLYSRSFSRTSGIVFLGSTVALPAIFAIRNLIAENSLSLMSSFWDGETYNAFLNGCASLSCATIRVAANPTGFVFQIYLNAIRFWSPHSGPLERGTWLHNVSLLSLLNKIGFQGFSIWLSVVTSLLIFLSWLIGSWRLCLKNFEFGLLFLLISLSIWVTDILVYGENRHRLIALVFMLPAHAEFLVLLYSKFESWKRREL